jgi:hypothetical protein
MITPILQSRLLCAHDISVPVESLSTAITDIPTSLVMKNDNLWCTKNGEKWEENLNMFADED